MHHTWDDLFVQHSEVSNESGTIFTVNRHSQVPIISVGILCLIYFTTLDGIWIFIFLPRHLYELVNVTGVLSSIGNIP